MPHAPEDAQGTQLKREPKLVKKPTAGAHDGRPRRDFRRHFRGYELGLLTVVMVLTFALLALPRASVPETLPLPRIDRGESRQRDARENQLAASAEREPLPFEVRAVGEAIRKFGARQAQGLAAELERREIQQCVEEVTAQGRLPLLLRLRAVQTRFFLAALAHFEASGKPNRELDELGGDFLTRARDSGWLDDTHQSLADASTLRVLYQLRWAELIDKRRVFPFSPSLNDWRIYYRFQILHPERVLAPPDPGQDDEARLKLVSALARKDPDYPEAFAKGYLYFRLGNLEAAAASYRAQLGKSESGPYALLARNYLIYALQGISPE